MTATWYSNPYNVLTAMLVGGTAVACSVGITRSILTNDSESKAAALQAQIERCASPFHDKAPECKPLAAEVASYKAAIEESRARETARREARLEQERQRRRAEAERIRLANAWIPKGFSVDPADPAIAYRWVDNPQCGYSSCVQLEVVPRDGCNTLYVQANILDASDRNIGYINDLTSGVRPGQIALMTMRGSADGWEQTQLNEINCY